MTLNTSQAPVSAVSGLISVTSRGGTPVALIDQPLTPAAFQQLCGNLAGYPFVKIVIDREQHHIHFINHAHCEFHADYVAENILGMTKEDLFKNLDKFNHSLYQDPHRRFYLGMIALHKNDGHPFYTFETVEVDTMDASMLTWFFDETKKNLEHSLPLLIKPANQMQEQIVKELDEYRYPRIFTHELFSSSSFIPLNEGHTQGRLRVFHSEEEFEQALASIEWFDIIAMARVPDNVPRVAGIINSCYTTPLSHTNVLAHGWEIPNSIQLDILDELDGKHLNGTWVEYSVSQQSDRAQIEKINRPLQIPNTPAWRVHQIKLEEPETEDTPILPLEKLRISDRFRYGTKAANIGELKHVLDNGSERLTGFYRIKRPPRDNLLPYLADLLEVPAKSDLNQVSWDFLKTNIRIPRGIAIPFSIQQEFLQSSPKIQQAIGKIKMALELGAKNFDPLCHTLSQLVRNTRLPDKLRFYIDEQIAEHLGGVSSFVVRSSSNAEDLEHFSAAGIYESKNHVTTAEHIFESIKDVWASLLSARSIRLRQEVGISLDDVYMGVIIQEEVKSDLGGVLVTTNPLDPKGDFRNVYINACMNSVVNVVEGKGQPYQFLFNTLEGVGKTLSLGDAKQDLSKEQKLTLRKLAVASRLLQSHFSPDYTFSYPIDVEWTSNPDGLYILQIRPYAR